MRLTNIDRIEGQSQVLVKHERKQMVQCGQIEQNQLLHLLQHSDHLRLQCGQCLVRGNIVVHGGLVQKWSGYRIL